MNDFDDFNERMSRIAMASGQIDPGHYFLVVNGGVPLEVCRIPQELLPVYRLLESKCLSCSLFQALSGEQQQDVDNFQDQLQKCNQKLCRFRLCHPDTNDQNSETSEQIDERR